MSSNHITVNSLVSRKSKDLYNSTIHTTEFLNEQRTRIDIISYIYKQPRSMGTETNVKLMSTESVMLSNHLILCRPISFCLQSFLASGSFPKSWLVSSGGQSMGVSASVLQMNIQGSFPLGFTGLISLQSKRLSRVFFSTTI